jgi:hypothetical protein
MSKATAIGGRNPKANTVRGICLSHESERENLFPDSSFASSVRYFYFFRLFWLSFEIVHHAA